jgi:ribosome-binding protein aMBF1 (putative translation factor)
MDRIKKVLEEQSRSQKWLAIRIGKSSNRVNAYVQDKQPTRSEVLNEMAKILEVDVKDLKVSSKP